MAAPALEFFNVSKDFPCGPTGRDRLRALDKLSFSVPAGSVVGLVGPNGSGKSTALRIALGLYTPNTGECRVHGHPAGTNPARACLGFVPDAGGLPYHLTAVEALNWFGELNGLSRHEAEARATTLLAETGLSDSSSISRPVRHFSRGMLQRLSIAQAMMTQPAVLLLDEPFSGLDPLARQSMERLLSRWASEGRTVLLSSHLLPRLETFCDDVVMLRQGQILAHGKPTELMLPDETDLEQCFVRLLGQRESQEPRKANGS